MTVVEKLKMLHKDAEKLASELPTEEMFMRFSEQVVETISSFIEEIEEG